MRKGGLKATDYCLKNSQSVKGLKEASFLPVSHFRSSLKLKKRLCRKQGLLQGSSLSLESKGANHQVSQRAFSTDRQVTLLLSFASKVPGCPSCSSNHHCPLPKAEARFDKCLGAIRQVAHLFGAVRQVSWRDSPSGSSLRHRTTSDLFAGPLPLPRSRRDSTSASRNHKK